MDIENIRELLPFYLNGTLNKHERELVEEALAASMELQAELRFWQHAAQSLHERQGHLSAEDLVARAQDRTPAIDRQTQDEHLATCVECSGLLHKTQRSLASQDVNEEAPPRTRYPVWKYALAAVCTLAVVVFVVRDIPGNDPMQPEMQPPPDTGTTAVRTIRSITLTYQPLMRASGKHQPAPVTLNDADSLVRVRFAIPRSTLEGVRYSLWREQGREKRTMIAEGLVRSGFGESYDTVAVDVSRSQLPAPHQQLRLIIREVLPPAASALTPEEYSFDLAGQSAP